MHTLKEEKHQLVLKVESVEEEKQQLVQSLEISQTKLSLNSEASASLERELLRKAMEYEASTKSVQDDNIKLTETICNLQHSITQHELMMNDMSLQKSILDESLSMLRVEHETTLTILVQEKSELQTQLLHIQREKEELDLSIGSLVKNTEESATLRITITDLKRDLKEKVDELDYCKREIQQQDELFAQQEKELATVVFLRKENEVLKKQLQDNSTQVDAATLLQDENFSLKKENTELKKNLESSPLQNQIIDLKNENEKLTSRLEKGLQALKQNVTLKTEITELQNRLGQGTNQILVEKQQNVDEKTISKTGNNSDLVDNLQQQLDKSQKDALRYRSERNKLMHLVQNSSHFQVKKQDKSNDG